VTRRGQSLVELALILPLLLLLAFGAAQFVRLALTKAGLDAATAAAAAAAARAPSAASAAAAGTTAFAGVAAGYGLDPATPVAIASGDFVRGGRVAASAAVAVDLGFSGIPALGTRWRLDSSASARIEDWRSRAAPP
jgi:Flp pilus assembly protein TadG